MANLARKCAFPIPELGPSYSTGRQKDMDMDMIEYYAGRPSLA